MQEDDCKRIRKTFKQLVDNIIASAVGDNLIQEGVFDEEDLEEILAQTTTKGKTRKLLRMLMKKPSENVFTKFCKVLRECDANYGYLADALESADISDMDSSPPVDDVDQTTAFTEELRKQLMTQTQLIVEMKQDYQKEMASLRDQLSSTGSAKSDMQDVVDAGFHEIHLREYVKQYCVSEKTRERRLSGGKPAEQGAAVNQADDAAFPNIWGLIRSTAAGGRRSSCSITLSAEEIACRIGVEVVRHTILSRLERSSRNMSHSASTDSIMSSRTSYAQPEPTVFIEASSIMKAMVVSILADKAAEFDEMVGLLDISELEGYTTFKSIADEMFGTMEEDQQEIKWGRVVAWYALWSHFFSILPVDEHLDEKVEVYGRYVGFYLARRLSTWMISANGWEGFVDHYKKSSGGSGYGTLVWRVITELIRQYPLRP